VRVLYVQQYLGNNELAVMPIGLLYVATAASKHRAKLLDMNVVEDPYGDLEQAIREFDPDVVALSLRNIDNQQRLNLVYFYRELPKTLQLIRRIKPDVRLVIGGAGFSLFPQAIMERNPEIDFGVYLEGEQSFPLLLEHLEDPETVKGLYYRQGKKVVFSGAAPMVDLTELPIPRKDLLDDIKVYDTGKNGVGIHTKRGCPYRCSYCNYFLLNGFRIRMRRPEQIVDEIEELVTKYGINDFMFADGVFSNPFEHVKQICEEIKRRELNVAWAAWCEVKDITEEFIDTVVSAGCCLIVISPDGYSNGALKGLNKGITTRDVRRAVKLILRYPEVRIGFGFFLTAPGETFLGYLSMMAYYFTVLPWIMLRRKGGGGFSWVRLEPETEIRKQAIRDGLISEETDLLPDDDDQLRRLFYVKPSLRFLDPLSRLVVGGVNAVKSLRHRPK
jgi:hypothetical protein